MWALEFADDELQAELRIAAVRPRSQARRLEAILLELARRAASRQPDLPMP